MMKGLTCKGQKDAKATVNGCHTGVMLSCRRNMCVPRWELRLKAAGPCLWTAQAGGSGWGQLGQPNEKYGFRTCWNSGERLQKWKWGGWRKSM